MTDQELIEHHGGPAKLAEILGLEKDGGVQRVHNWIARGIPSKVKLSRPDLFLKDFATTQPTEHKEAAISPSTEKAGAA